MNHHPLKLVLGTAQFGSKYGVANKYGQPEQRIATAIVREAWESGIREFDTAQGYGTSETVLGKALCELNIQDKAKIISKFDPGLDHLNFIELSNALDKSLNRLGVSSLYSMMLHREELLALWSKGLGDIMQQFIVSGKVQNIGVSVYSPDKALKALSLDGIEMVQLPSNILDRRFINAGVFQLADKKRKKIYIRSVFLQGLLLIRSEEIPVEMNFCRPVIEKLETLLNKFRLSRHDISIGYIKKEMPNANIVFGVDTPKQVSENVEAWKKKIPGFSSSEVKDLFADVDERILNPSLWPK